MTSSDGSRSTNTSRLSQFGIYKSIDARTEEFLRLSRKRQLRQGCACAALSTAITVTIVVAGLLVYEYTTTLDVKSHQEPGRSNWHGLFNTSSAFDPAHYKAKITVDPTTLKLLPVILKALNHNRYLEKFLEDYDTKKLKYPSVTKQTPEYSFYKRLLPTAKMRTNPSVHVKYNFPLVKPSINNQNLELFRKNKNSKHQENVLKYFNKMIDSNAYRGPLSLNEKENAKSPFFEYPVDIVGKRNSTATRESKTFVYSDDHKAQNKVLTKKQIRKPIEISEATVTLKNSIDINTLIKPTMYTIPMKKDITFIQQVPKSEINKLGIKDCVCTMKLLNLLHKLMINIRDIIPELLLYEKGCHEAVRFETFKTKTKIPVKFLTVNLATEPSMTTDRYTTTTVPETTSTTVTVPTTIPTTKTVPTTIPTTTTPTTTDLNEKLTTYKMTSSDGETLRKMLQRPIFKEYKNKGMKILHNPETTTEKISILRDLLEEPINPEFINRELSNMRNTQYTTIKSSIEQTYSYSDIPTTEPIKLYSSYRSEPLYYTNANKIVELLNEFKQKVEQNMKAEYDQEMEFPRIIDENRNIEPKLLPGVEILNPRTLEGYNRMKLTEDESETDDVNSFKSILNENINKIEEIKRESISKNHLNYTQPNKDINKEYHTTKSIFQQNNLTSTLKPNNFAEVFKNYAEVNALISRTQNLSDATMYELYKKKEDDNSTALDYDEVIEGIETEQISPLIRRSKQTQNKDKTTKHNPINTETMDVRSMLPIGRSSYLEIHRSVTKQDAQDYDNTDPSNNAEHK